MAGACSFELGSVLETEGSCKTKLKGRNNPELEQIRRRLHCANSCRLDYGLLNDRQSDSPGGGKLVCKDVV